MKLKLDTVVTTVLVICAVVTTALVVRRELATPEAPAGQASQKPVLIKNWKQDLSKGVLMGPAEAPVQLIELADFECPACGDLHKTLDKLRERYPTQVALTFVHHPLEYHRFAQPAARVAECAGNQGRFEAMHDVLFTQQKEFGLKPWTDMSKEAGVPDTVAFETCIQSKEPIPRVAEGMKLGKDVSLQGTPTLIVNGWKLGGPPTLEKLDEMVKAVLAGKSPISAEEQKS